jgi:hypothetical protein
MVLVEVIGALKLLKDIMEWVYGKISERVGLILLRILVLRWEMSLKCCIGLAMEVLVKVP